MFKFEPGTYIDDKNRKIEISKEYPDIWTTIIDDNIKVSYRSKKDMIRDLRKSSKTYTKGF